MANPAAQALAAHHAYGLRAGVVDSLASIAEEILAETGVWPGTASASDVEQGEQEDLERPNTRCTLRLVPKAPPHMLPSPPQMPPPIELRVKAALQQHTARPGSARRRNHTAIGQHPIVLNQGRQRAHLSPDEPRPTPQRRASAEGQALPALNAWQANDGEEEPNSANHHAQNRQATSIWGSKKRSLPQRRANAEGQALPAANAWQSGDGEEKRQKRPKPPTDEMRRAVETLRRQRGYDDPTRPFPRCGVIYTKEEIDAVIQEERRKRKKLEQPSDTQGASSRKKQGAWENAGGPGSASSMKREPIYDKETGTLYALNPMELDALKQRFSMRASPQRSKEDDAAPEQDDVPGQDGWRKDGWREDDWGRDGWREDTWDKDGWDNDGWREDGSGKGDSGKGDWLEGSGGKDSWGKDSWGKAEDTGYHGDENDDGEDKGVDDHGGKRKGKWWQGHQQDEWHDKSKTTSELEESYCAGCDCYDCDCLKAKEERDDETMSNSDEPGSASSSARASFKHPGLRDAMEKWAEQASIRENKALDIARKSKANQQREARDTHREWLDRKYLKRTLKRLAKYDELGLAK